MALINDVKTICDRLAPFGWRDLLRTVTANGLDITQSSTAQLQAELTKSLPTIDRSQIGFDDFHPMATQGITAGRPSKSLLLHAFASSRIHPTGTQTVSPNANHYPTLSELDTLENYVYSLVADRTDLEDTVVAVFALQYRVGVRTAHSRYADLTFSRTGVARVGTGPEHYDSSRRSFWVIPQDGSNELSVLPARYAAFLARRALPGSSGSVRGGHTGPSGDTYLFPVHKLFDGTECITGRTLSLQFEEFHRNEKLNRTHRLPTSAGGLPVPNGFDTTKNPYVRDSANGGGLATLQRVGASVLVVPTPGTALNRTITQQNSLSGTDEIVHFIVPPAQTITRPGGGLRSTRFFSSLEIPAFGSDRLSPEYVNIRHEIDPTAPVTQAPIDLNGLDQTTFNNRITAGGYAAAHFIDDTCDGCIEAVVNGLDDGTENLLGFSLITAVDFFPLADQAEVNQEITIQNVRPLSEGRLPVNPTLPRPSDHTQMAFDRNDHTVTAVVGEMAAGPALTGFGDPNRMVSSLPDGASDVFAPGWDTSRTRDMLGVYLTSSGLGSPFPEDAKLCAALASFWPAVAPDNGRTFDADLRNQLPMLDEELGFHPNHERVTSGEVVSHRGWDGEYGPFFETIGVDTFVNHADIERSDYVSQALAGRLTVTLTAEIQSEQLIARHRALNACQVVLNGSARPHLVVVQAIEDWLTFGAGRPELVGSGFLMVFADLTGSPQTTSDTSRLRHRVARSHICQVGTNGIAYKRGGAAFTFHAF